MNKCITCAHAVAYPDDLTKRVCRGMPPQLITIPTGPGQIQLRNMYPTVNATDDGCGLHKTKVVIDNTEGNA